MDGPAVRQGCSTRPRRLLRRTSPILYAHVHASIVTQPAQQLIGFATVEVGAGKSRRVAFTVFGAQFAHTDAAGEFAVGPCRVDLFIGRSADDRCLEGSLTLTGERRVLRNADRVFFSSATMRPREEDA